MPGIRRLVVYGAVTGLLTAGAVTASMQVAHADTPFGSCTGDGGNPAPWDCTINVTAIPSMSALTVTVTDAASEDVTIDVATLSCTYGTTTDSEPPSSETGATPLTDDVTPLPLTAQTGTCDVVVNMSLPSADPTPLTDYTATLSYTPIASATPTPSATPASSSAPVHPVKGYDGKCVDDNGNSSANRAKIQIWGCNGSDKAENWTYSNGEFVHNGKCLNDQGNGGNRSHVILYSCNGGVEREVEPAGQRRAQAARPTMARCAWTTRAPRPRTAPS